MRIIFTVYNKVENKFQLAVKPDVCNDGKIDERGCLDAPYLVIEMLSRGNTEKEKCDSAKIYAEKDSIKSFAVKQRLFNPAISLPNSCYVQS